MRRSVRASRRTATSLAASARHDPLVVVVAEDCEDAAGRGQWRERLHAATDVGAVGPARVVAEQHDEIGPLGHQQPRGIADERCRHERAVVKIRQDADADAVQRRRKVRKRHVRAGEGDVPRLVRDSVRAHGGEAEAAGEAGAEKRASRGAHGHGMVAGKRSGD